VPAKRGGGGGVKKPRIRTGTRKATTSKTILERDRAIDRLGRAVRPGKVKLGSTRNLTPTKAGFRALKREVSQVRRAIARKGAKPKAYSFQLSIKYRGADGRFKKLDKIEGTFPLGRAVRVRKKKGESDAKAFERITDARIKAAVFRAVDKAEGVAVYTPAVERALASGDRERITRAMRAFKKRRGVSFKVTVERHVTTGEAGRAKKRATKKTKGKAQTVRGRARQRR
jgi:hypothetical protein